MSPTAFGLYFDRVVEYIRSVLHHPSTACDTADWVVFIAHFAIQLALYADDLAFVARSVRGL